MPSIINFHALTPGMLETINHPAMPDLATLQQGNQSETWCLVERGKLGAICSLWLDRLPRAGDAQPGETRAAAGSSPENSSA